MDKREKFAVSLRKKKKDELIILRRGKRVIYDLAHSQFFAEESKSESLEVGGRRKWRINDPGKVQAVLAVLNKQ